MVHSHESDVQVNICAFYLFSFTFDFLFFIKVSTLSHMGTSKDNKRHSCHSIDSSINDTMNIDTRQLYDPDALWKRTTSRLILNQ